MPRFGTFKQTRNIPWTEEAQQFAQMAMMAAQVIGAINKQKEEKKQQELQNAFKVGELQVRIRGDKKYQALWPSAEKSLVNINQTLKKYGYDLGWEEGSFKGNTDSFTTYFKNLGGALQDYKSGKITGDIFFQNARQGLLKATEPEEVKYVEQMIKAGEEVKQQQGIAGIIQQLQPQQVPTGIPDISKWQGVPTQIPMGTRTEEPDYEKILSNIPLELKDAPVVKMLEEKIKAQREKPTLPYKIGERQKYTGKDGKEYEGTFTGLDANKEPVFTNIVKVTETGKESAEDAAAKAAARTSAGLRAWKQTFKDMMGREPSKEEIRRKLINDPYGMLSPEEETETPPIPKDQYKVGTVYTDKQGRKAKYLGKGQWQLVK